MTTNNSEAAKRGWETRRANGHGRHTEESKARMAISQMIAAQDPGVRERRGRAISRALRARAERLLASRVTCPHCEGRGYTELSELDNEGR